MFNVEIRSNYLIDQTFQVFSPEVSWDIDIGGSFTVPKKESINKTLIVTPLQNVNPGRHTLPIIFKAVGSAAIRKVLILDVSEALPPGASYLPSIRGELHIQSELDPRRPVKVGLVIKNQNKRTLDDVQIKLRSEFINGDFKTSLGPLEEKTLTYDIRLDPSSPPRKDTLTAHLLVEADKQYQFDILPTQYKILSYGEIVEDTEETEGFLTKNLVISLKNSGNDEIGHVFSVPASFWSRPFVDSSLPGEFKQGELRWNIRIEPGEELKVDVEYNYQPAFWILLALLIGLALYYQFRSPVLIKKSARIIKTKEDGISELKVVIELHNRSRGHIRHVTIMDMVPHVAKYVEGPSHGLKPSKIVPHEHKGTLIKWDIGMLDSKEQRILTYTARCKFTVLGSMTLPVTVVKFVVGRKHRQVVSNRFTLSIS
jgi:hypothetical protein